MYIYPLTFGRWTAWRIGCNVSNFSVTWLRIVHLLIYNVLIYINNIKRFYYARGHYPGYYITLLHISSSLIFRMFPQFDSVAFTWSVIITQTLANPFWLAFLSHYINSVAMIIRSFSTTNHMCNSLPTLGVTSALLQHALSRGNRLYLKHEGNRGFLQNLPCRTASRPNTLGVSFTPICIKSLRTNAYI
jgi:hypothetical protein